MKILRATRPTRRQKQIIDSLRLTVGELSCCFGNRHGDHTVQQNHWQNHYYTVYGG